MAPLADSELGVKLSLALVSSGPCGVRSRSVKHRQEWIWVHSHISVAYVAQRTEHFSRV
jgi:hypothetical protein